MDGIARLWKPVVHVTDLDAAERFWAAVPGLSPMGRRGGEFSVLVAEAVRRIEQIGPARRRRPRESAGPAGSPPVVLRAASGDGTAAPVVSTRRAGVHRVAERRGLLNPIDRERSGSPWWRAANERLLRDTCSRRRLAGSAIRGGM
jgi:hypothetical protein